MKKIISIILSTTILTSSLIMPTFAQTELNSTNLSQESGAERTLFITDLFNKLGCERLANLTEQYKPNGKKSSSLFETLSKKSLTCGLLSVAIAALGTATLHAQGFMNMLWAYDYIKDKLRDGVHIFDWINPPKEVTIEETISRLNKGLDDLKGQDKAKESIKKVVYGIAHNKNQAKFNNETYSHGDVIYIPGPSGVGKSFVATRIAHALSNCKPFVVSASDVDLQDKESIVGQLFNFDDYNCGYGASIKEKKQLVKYIQRNKKGVVIINEFDKMSNPSLDEVFRTVSDQGIVNVRGQTLDCRGITFIITSNENTNCLKAGNQDEIENLDDGTGSRTFIKHDKSFLNRVKLIEFENLSEKDYEEIAISEYAESFPKYWEKYANIKLNMGDTFKNIAKMAVKENKGARVIHSAMDGLTKELAEYTVKNKQQTSNLGKNEPEKAVNLLVSYDSENNQFSLNEVKD